jgi:hypothetical protein
MLEVAHKNDIELEGACEGSLACSTCHVIIQDQAGGTLRRTAFSFLYYKPPRKKDYSFTTPTPTPRRPQNPSNISTLVYVARVFISPSTFPGEYGEKKLKTTRIYILNGGSNDDDERGTLRRRVCTTRCRSPTTTKTTWWGSPVDDSQYGPRKTNLTPGAGVTTLVGCMANSTNRCQPVCITRS